MVTGLSSFISATSNFTWLHHLGLSSDPIGCGSKIWKFLLNKVIHTQKFFNPQDEGLPLHRFLISASLRNCLKTGFDMDIVALRTRTSNWALLSKIWFAIFFLSFLLNKLIFFVKYKSHIFSIGEDFTT